MTLDARVNREGPFRAKPAIFNDKHKSDSLLDNNDTLLEENSGVRPVSPERERDRERQRERDTERETERERQRERDNLTDYQDKHTDVSQAASQVYFNCHTNWLMDRDILHFPFLVHSP